MQHAITSKLGTKRKQRNKNKLNLRFQSEERKQSTWFFLIKKKKKEEKKELTLTAWRYSWILIIWAKPTSQGIDCTKCGYIWISDNNILVVLKASLLHWVPTLVLPIVELWLWPF